jgi:ribosomal protein S10
MSKVNTSVQKTKKTTVKKQEEVVEPVPVPVPTEETTVQEEAHVTETTTLQTEVNMHESIRERLVSIINSTTTQIDTLKQTLVDHKRLLKDFDALVKQHTKKQKKVKEPRDYTKPRTPTGFAVPKMVSKELYTFLVDTKAQMKDVTFVPKSKEDEDNWPRVPVKAGQPVARTDVVSHLHNYIKVHNLSTNDVLTPDAKLKKILPQLPTYSKKAINGYISSHFPSTKASE